jgi:acyl-CoA synthetase (AMP-forming)/AMP-acid ligase II
MDAIARGGYFHSRGFLESRRIIRQGDCGVTNSGIPEWVAAVAAALAELDVRQREHVLIMLPDGPGFGEVLTGLTQRGAVPLPVNPKLPAHLILSIAAEAGAHLVLTSIDRIRALADLTPDPPVVLEGPQGPWAVALRLH